MAKVKVLYVNPFTTRAIIDDVVENIPNFYTL